MLRHATTVLAMLAVLGAAPSPLLAKASTPTVVAPSSKWLLDYGEGSCSLRRLFGTGKQQIRLEFQQASPGIGMTLAIASESIAKNSPVYRTEIGFGPDAFGTFENEAIRAEAKNNEQVLIAGVVAIRRDWMMNKPTKKQTAEELMKIAADWPKPGKAEIEEAEKRASTLTIHQKGGLHVTLQTGSMAAPMRLMRHCVDTLLVSWGIDPAVEASLKSRAKPIGSPGKWVESSDFPANMLSNGQGAVLRFRLIVNPDGTVDNCRITSGAGHKDFWDLTCNLIAKRARFSPAIDSNGNPVKSIYSNSVYWDLFP